MERTKRTTKEGEIQWRKMGGGFLHLPNRIIKPGDVFFARPADIPKAFRDTVIPLDKEELRSVEENPVELILVNKPEYTKVKREGSNWWDIVDAQGKVINEKALREPQAEEYLQSLQR